MNIKNNKAIHIGVAALSFFILFMGFGRVLNFVTHDPVLAYANSYDMIPLQACHQIWPAGAGIDIRKGTPEAPLRAYTLSKQVDTPCMPSSELLFTGVAIRLAILKNRMTGEKLVSIKTIGLVKAAFLFVTAFLMHGYFMLRRNAFIVLLHAISVCTILSDPGVTLYLSTFYAEFSAVFFMYVILCSAVNLGSNREMFNFHGLLLFIGLVGFGFSMPQYATVVMLIGIVLAICYLLQKSIWFALGVLVISLFPYMVFNNVGLVPQNHNLELAYRTNAFSAMFESSSNPATMAERLDLPDHCVELAGRKAYEPDMMLRHPCKEIMGVGYGRMPWLLITEPLLPVRMALTSLPKISGWIIDYYGHVEGEKFSNVSEHHWSISKYLKVQPENIFMGQFIAPTLFWILALFFKVLTKRAVGPTILYFILTSALQWGVLFTTLFTFGYVDAIKHCHIAILLALFNLTSMILYCGIILAPLANKQWGKPV